MALIGLDIGSTGCKCTIFSIDGKVQAFAYKEYNMLKPKPGHFELNPHTVWESVKSIIYNAVSKYKGEKITAISVSSFGEAAVPIDKDGNILANSILYLDKRGTKECSKIKKALGTKKIMQLVGLSAHPMFTINKIMWIKENMPEIYKNTWKFMLFGDFISYLLTGSAVIDYSLASRTMAFNVVKKKWEDEIFNAAGIDIDLFSKVSPSATIISGVKKQLAQELGLPSNVVVATGGHDQVCAALGAGIIESGLAIDGIGTVECITPCFDKPILNNQMLQNNFNCAPHVIDGMYVTYAFNFTGGILLKWYRDTFALYEKKIALEKNENVYEVLDKMASKKPTDILVLPHFAGSGTPYMDTSAKGAILGLDINTTSSEIYRSMLEGVTYEMALNMEYLQMAGININTLRAVGGGAKSDLWLQIKADIMQRKVERLSINEAGTLGTAILAGVATGVYKSLKEASNSLIKVKKEFYPNPKFKKVYEENFNRYKKIYKNIRNIYEK